jgi:hypothetical protein
LRAAIREANALGGGAIGLNFGSYTLTRTGDDDTAQNGDLDIIGDLLIVGSGAAGTFVQACDVGGNPNCTGIDRVFDVQPNASLTMTFVTVRKGLATAGGGGGIFNRGTLSLSTASLDGNTGGNGAGLRNIGGTATATLARVSIVNNRTDNGNGGGILSLDAGLSLTNVTLSGNTAIQGGGLFVGGSATTSATLTNVTIANNANTTTLPGAGIYVGTGTVTLRNSIVANNTSSSGSPNNCGNSGTFASGGFNLVFPGTGCGMAAGTNDLLNADPKLGPLQNNGGPTPTRALLAGSAAIDAGNPAAPGSSAAACATTDQRSIVRPQDGDAVGGARCDIGAFEARLVDVCALRPPVQLVATRNGQGGLNVTVTRGLGALTELRLHGDPSAHVAAPNVLVDLPLFPGARGEIVIRPAAGSISQQFTVRPDNPNAPTTLPMEVFDACGVWQTLVGGGVGSVGSVGTFTLAGLGPSLAPGQTSTALLEWALPAPRRWRELATIELRLRDADGVAWGVRWTETGDTFVVTETRTPPLFALASPRTQESGPTRPAVTLTVPVQALGAAAGRTFALEVRASDDAGVVQGFEPAGSLTVPVAASAAPTVQESAVQAPIVETRNADKPPKLSEQERWQQARTNAGSSEDERIEGDVLAVDCTARPPTITIGNRDGEVIVELRGEAVGDCERTRPGQYVQADGEKVHEQRFLADRVNAE